MLPDLLLQQLRFVHTPAAYPDCEACSLGRLHSTAAQAQPCLLLLLLLVGICSLHPLARRSIMG